MSSVHFGDLQGHVWKLKCNTRTSRYLGKRFCKMFSKSSRVVPELPCSPGKQMELSEKMLTKPLLQVAAISSKKSLALVTQSILILAEPIKPRNLSIRASVMAARSSKSSRSSSRSRSRASQFQAKPPSFIRAL